MNTRRFNALPFFIAVIALIWLLPIRALSFAEAQSDSIILNKVFQATLHEYILTTEEEAQYSGRHFELGEIHTDGEWAYTVVQGVTTKEQDSLDDFVVLLAYNDPYGGWYALAPENNTSEEYNSLLNSFPDRLIDESTKAYLWQPNLYLAANFSGHSLPWPAGRDGYVPKKNGSGHENQIDFNIYGTDAIYASKPGTVVFVKESSSANCTTPPPDLCWKKANMVVIQHGPSEYSWYVHLAYNSVPVNVGSYVGLGTKIGLEGSTGYASGKHLHYMVSNSVPNEWPKSSNPNDAPWPPRGSIIAVDFEEYPWSELKQYGTYVSQNTSDPAAVSWEKGRIDLFVQSENNGLWQKTYSGVWGSWTSLGGILVSAPDAASWGSGHVDVYARGIDNNIYYQRYLNGSWSGWASAGQPPDGANSDPSAVSRSNGCIDLFVRGGDNALWHRPHSNGSWGSWTSLGGFLSTGPDAASWGSNHMDVYVSGSDNALYYRRHSNGSWGRWQWLGGELTADPGAVSPNSNQVSVFVRGITNELWHRTYNGNWGDWELLGGYLTSDPDAASWGDGHLDVFVRGTDDNIYHRWNLGGLWSGWGSLGRP